MASRSLIPGFLRMPMDWAALQLRTRLPDMPSPVLGQSAVYDDTSNRLIVFQNDVWVLVDANGIGSPSWVQLSPTGTLPPPRGAACELRTMRRQTASFCSVVKTVARLS